MAIKTTTTLALTFCISTLTSAPIQAQERVDSAAQPVATRFARDIPRRHDRGALVHSMVGVGYSTASSLSGVAALGMGWLPAEQIGLSLDGWAMLGATEWSIGVGPGVTYFFTDSAMHLRFSLSAVVVHNDDATSAWTPGASLMFGATPYITPSASLGLGVLLTGYTGLLQEELGAGLGVSLGLAWVFN